MHLGIIPLEYVYSIDAGDNVKTSSTNVETLQVLNGPALLLYLFVEKRRGDTLSSSLSD